MSVLNTGIKELHKQLESKAISVSELVDTQLERIKATDETLNCFITIDEEGARATAAQLDEQEDKEALLFGVPLGLTDNLSTKGVKTTGASRMLADFVPAYDATVVEKLKEARAVSLGKLNLDEFGLGASTETSYFKPVRNPWNTDYVAGGATGGAAAGVAADQLYVALGSDVGGAVRQAASLCGVVGLKPTYGLVSRFGLISPASSLDQVGAITKRVEDAAFVLQAIAGHDPHDTTSAQVSLPDYGQALTGEVTGLKVAVPTVYIGEGVDPEVREQVLAALKALEDLGVEWEEVTVPHLEHAFPAYYLISSAEASSNLGRYDGVRYGFRAESDDLIEMYKKTRGQGFGTEAKRRIIVGTHVLSSDGYERYFKKAQQVRALVKQDFDTLFEKYDVVLGPTTPHTAWKIGEKTDPLAIYEAERFTCAANLAGLPAISVPCGQNGSGLPIGLQMIGPAFQEATILRLAHAFEQQTEHHLARPSL